MTTDLVMLVNVRLTTATRNGQDKRLGKLGMGTVVHGSGWSN